MRLKEQSPCPSFTRWSEPLKRWWGTHLDNSRRMPASFFSTTRFSLWKAPGKNGKPSEMSVADIQFGPPAPNYRGGVSCFRRTASPFQSICDALTAVAKPGFLSSINQIAVNKYWNSLTVHYKPSIDIESVKSKKKSANDSSCVCEAIQGATRQDRSENVQGRVKVREDSEETPWSQSLIGVCQGPSPLLGAMKLVSTKNSFYVFLV